MLFRRKRREVPGLNTSSTADISFMLLIFFLVTTSMDADMGMSRQLPPDNPDDNTEQMDVDKSKVLSLALDANGTLTIDGKPAATDKCRRQLKKFIVKAGPSHILEMKIDANCDYNTYFQLQNEIVRAYKDIRNAAAKQRYGKEYAKCSQQQRDALTEDFPQRVQEVY